MRAGAVLPAVLLLLPTAAALNPLDDDAGSGGDAGDALGDALAVGPGTHAGRLTSPADEVDAYAFEGRGGDWVHVRLDARRFLVGSLYGPEGMAAAGDTIPHGIVTTQQERTLLLPHDGTWYLVLRTGASAKEPLEAPYTFSLAFERPATAVAATPAQAWSAFEFAWDEPARVVFDARLPMPAEAAAPTAMFLLVQAHLEPAAGAPGDVTFGMYVGAGGAGRAVRLDPGGVAAELPAGDPALPVRLSERGGSFGFHQQASSERVAGWLRAVVLHSPDARPSLAFSADVPARQAHAAGQEVAAWTEASGDAALRAVAPGAAVAGPREHPLEVRRLGVGFFSPQLFRGSVEQPDGTSHALDLSDEAFLLGLADGTWRFRLDATAGAADSAQDHYLLAADVPELGVAPALRQGLALDRSPDACEWSGLC